jgi:hypothetical protein
MGPLTNTSRPGGACQRKPKLPGRTFGGNLMIDESKDIGGIVAPDGHYYPRCDTDDGFPPLSATPLGKQLMQLMAECLAKPDPEATDAKKAT